MAKKNIDNILNEVLLEIKPDAKSFAYANNFISTLNDLIKKNKIDATAVLGGSMAKNTFLAKDYDADVFVKFNKSYKGQNISSLLESVLKKNYKFERVKGSRDYYHVYDTFLFELVPVLDVATIYEAENVIDMSPLHVDYFKKKGAGLEDEVRLLKRFMKASRVYGAESFINGFSGHVVDLLIIKYGGFINVLKATRKWKTPVVIDIERKLKNPLMELDKSKISGPLIIVDPVQEQRNAAAALGFDCFNLFVECANKFLDAPSKDFFELKSAKEIINKKNTNGLLLEFVIEPVKGSKDIAGSKVLKMLEFLKSNLKQNDFVVRDFEWDFSDKGHAYFVIDETELEPIKDVRGPPLTHKEHCQAFLDKHKDTYEKNGFLHAKIKREFVNPKKLIDKLIKDNYVLERSKSVKYSILK